MMNRKIIISILTLVLLLAFAVPAFAQEPDKGGDQVLFGDNFVLEAEQVHKGDLAVLGGSATLEANSKLAGNLAVFGGDFEAEENTVIDGDVVVFGGNVDIKGTINGDLAAIGGNVDLSDTATVNGDIGMVGGDIDRDEGATVKGDIQGITQFRENDDDDNDGHGDFLNPPDAPSPPSENWDWDHSGNWDHSNSGGLFGWIGQIVGDVFWNLALIAVLAVITWLVAAFMPEQMYNVRETLVSSAPLSFGVGLLTAIVSVVFIPIAFLLVITICLAIVPVVAYLALGIAVLFGWIVIGHVLGERLLVASGRPQPSLIMSSIVGVSVLTLVTNLPVIGLIDCIGFIGTVIGGLIAMAGLGAVLLTRFGTRPYPYQAEPIRPRSGGPSSGTPYYPGTRTRWTDPAPEVSEEDTPSSDDELRAKIREALAEADEIEAAKAKAEAMREAEAGEPPVDDDGIDTPDKKKPEDEI
ncbi:MAG: polymer-forming cytoskeletal protein [Anaerolineae bacterium]|nr:polymer-forming cytoskeletal protein [Anaerolineae bacterium]